MSRFSVDYSSLEQKIEKKAYKLSEVRDRLETVAFDIVRFKDGDEGVNLWQIQSADDGDYIVALYQPEEEEKTAWDVSVNKIASSLQISYKGDPIVVLKANKLGISTNELDKVPGYLPGKLATNKKLVNSLLKEVPANVKAEILKKYPELI